MSILTVVDDVALRVVPTISNAPAPDDAVDETAFEACLDTYTCACTVCQLERAQRVRNGVRPSQPIPLRRAA